MCLIIHASEGMPDLDLLRSANINNSQGFGLMYLDDSDRVITDKIVPKSFKDIQEVLDNHEGITEFGLHFRLTTHGMSTPEMSHPFQVLDMETSGRDLFLMHNGPRLPVKLEEPNKSDTWHFVENILKPILEAKPELVDSPDFMRCLERMIGDDKILLLDSFQGFMRVNERAGTEKDNMWLSNTYSLNRSKGMNYNVHTGKVKPNTPLNLPVSRHTPVPNKSKDATPPTLGSRDYPDYYDEDWYWDQRTWETDKPTTPRTTIILPDDVDDEDILNISPVSTEAIIEAYCEDGLYEYALNNFEGLVSWLRETIKYPQAS